MEFMKPMEFFSFMPYMPSMVNDPAFGFRWPAEPAVISDKDRTFPDFSDAMAYSERD